MQVKSTSHHQIRFRSRSEASSGLVSSDENWRSTRNKSRESYTVPKESKEVQYAADARIKKALDKVPHTTHSNKETKRSEVTLYIGNLEYSATANQLDEALCIHFKRIHVKEIKNSNTNGRVRGYAFVTWSWAAG